MELTMGEENRLQAIQRLTERLSKNEGPFGPFYGSGEPFYESKESALDDTFSMLRPFLLNPDQHEEHVRLLIEYGAAAIFLQGLHGQVFSFMWRNAVGDLFKRLRQRFVERGEELEDDLLNQVDLEPSEFQVDVLPLRTLDTHQDWLNQGRRLVQIDTRTVAHPREGFSLQSVSHRIEVHSPPDVQFVDTIPSTAVEDIGSSEWSVSSKGKFVRSDSAGAEVGGSAGIGASNVESKLTTSSTNQEEFEAGSSHKKTRSDKVRRVISSAIGSVAQWELLRTPSQVLQGGNSFAASLLIPVETSKIELGLEIFARFEGWGRADHSDVRVLEVPEHKGDPDDAT